jgi:DNA-binding response OmpR family regulator
MKSERPRSDSQFMRPPANHLQTALETVAATILVLDDDRVGRLRVAEGLRRRGFPTIEAGHGAAALRIVAGRAIDLVILDIMMPQISGVQVLTTLRKHFTFDQLPVIMLTADSLEDSVREAMKTGANGYLAKPIDLETLVERVTAQLRRPG